MIIECNVWCVESDEAEKMGLESGNQWMPIAIDTRKIHAIKEAGENEFLGKGRATLFFESRDFIIDRTYAEMVEILKQERNG